MNTHTPITLRVLIVEDNEPERNAMGLFLNSIPEDIPTETVWPFGIPHFIIDKAASSKTAYSYLNKAQEADNPYDLCLLDLSLPEDDNGPIEVEAKGFDIMEYAMKINMIKKVIVVSGYPEYITGALRGHVFDFIAKPFMKGPLQTVVLNCLQHILTEESNRILNGRIKELVPYAEKGLAHGFTAAFSTLLNSITRASAEIEKYAFERYGLDPKKYPQDALVRQLRTHRESVEEAKQKWSELLPDEGAAPQVETVEDLLNDINEKLRTCLIVKRAGLHLNYPQSEGTPVLTFQSDVQAVLKEIIAGALSQLLDCGDQMEIKVTVEKNGTQAIVRFEDKMEKISKEDRNRINAGYSIVPDPKLGRVWGLSVAQHIALRGGGELKVEERKPRGNIITYYIPLATHAKDTGG